jgi:hypothetical protein
VLAGLGNCASLNSDALNDVAIPDLAEARGKVPDSVYRPLHGGYMATESGQK